MTAAVRLRGKNTSGLKKIPSPFNVSRSTLPLRAGAPLRLGLFHGEKCESPFSAKVARVAQNACSTQDKHLRGAHIFPRGETSGFRMCVCVCGGETLRKAPVFVEPFSSSTPEMGATGYFALPINKCFMKFTFPGYGRVPGPNLLQPISNHLKLSWARRASQTFCLHFFRCPFLPRDSLDRSFIRPRTRVIQCRRPECFLF